MQTINNRMTETQIADLFSLAVQLQVKAEESDDRDTAILAYSIQNACSNLTESRREFRAADATIHNLELQLTDMAVQLANAESKCRELAAANGRVVAERDALRENIGGDITRSAADIYFQLVEECEIPPGGSLVGYIDDIKDRLSNAENHTSELDNVLCELLPGTQYMDTPDGGSVTPLEQVRRMVADYRERIEELEARTVILPDVEKWRSVDAVRAQSAYKVLVSKVLAAAGIGVKGE
ncbi:hypothetical protein [Citrobacter portucalensis]|uniref:hypothetical protein n=1 Tax=Citrobacter portucalensis TaxID=1639133 RepID=UPI001F38092D|nr:hypothetical protein [Citrobacter portucalensis]